MPTTKSLYHKLAVVDDADGLPIAKDMSDDDWKPGMGDQAKGHWSAAAGNAKI